MQSQRRKVLILGGYGNFGRRLVGLLATDARLSLLIAGRSLDRARRFADGVEAAAELVPVALDRNGDVRLAIAEIAPDLVVDMSGPWQSYGRDPYRVARAAIDCGAHYVDLADSTRFVLGLTALDDLAKAREVFAITGASTCPALTGAAVRQLGERFSDIDSITGGISPSPHAGLGRSVIEAIAGYAGRTVRVLEDDAVVYRRTFVSWRRLAIAPPGAPPIARRLYSLVDVPDLQLLGVPGVPVRGIWFGVATRPPVYHRMLRAMARLVAWGVVPSLEPIAGAMHFVANRLTWGAHRGGLTIRVAGRDAGGNARESSWHLVAEGDTGPLVPVLATRAIIARWLDGDPPPAGARTACGELPLAAFEAQFRELGIVSGERSDPPPGDWPLYRRILGDAWTGLPQAIRELHEGGRFEGRGSVRRGASALSRLVAGAVGFPPPVEDVPVVVDIGKRGAGEQWRRSFEGHRFASVHSAGRGRLEGLLGERFGPVRVAMALIVRDRALHYEPVAWTLLGLPMPSWLLPRGIMHETESDGRFHFHVEIRLPLAGHLVTYQGWLEPAD